MEFVKDPSASILALLVAIFKSSHFPVSNIRAFQIRC